jgi:hypothetical protein
MNRNSINEISGRVMHMAARFTLNKGNDISMMQELAMDCMNSEGRKAVERIQSYGFSSVPLPRDEAKQGSEQSGGDSEQPKGPAAEGIALFLGGQRNHPVVIGVDDRMCRRRSRSAGRWQRQRRRPHRQQSSTPPRSRPRRTTNTKATRSTPRSAAPRTRFRSSAAKPRWASTTRPRRPGTSRAPSSSKAR